MATDLPRLELREIDGRCVLVLGGHVRGEGDTLQDAGDELVRRVLDLATGPRGGAPFDVAWLAFLDQVAEVAAGGGDVRELVFGVSRITPAP
jgi:hypothetical protein